MERGVSTGAREEADPPILSGGTSQRRMTERILERADGAGYRAALIDAADGTITPWPLFARTILAAAHGLRRRGLADGDTAAVLVQDAASLAIAVNAIRGAGATAALIPADASPPDVAARLNARGARLLITSAPLAELAAEGADRSRVRQVIAFGEAAGTTPFSSLLESPRTDPAGSAASGHDVAASQDRTAGQDVAAGQDAGNRPASTRVPGHARLVPAPDPAGDLTHRDVVVAAPPCGNGEAYVSLIDLTLLTGATLVAAPLPLVTAAMGAYKGTAVIVPRGTDVPGIPAARVYPVALPAASVQPLSGPQPAGPPARTRRLSPAPWRR